MLIKKYGAVLITVLFTVALVCAPSDALDAAKTAYKICENTVIPSLLPFFVCSNMLAALNVTEYLSKILKPVMKPVFGVGENSAFAVIMGIISGYPVGAKTAVMLKEKGLVTKSEAEKLLAFCNNSGPLFILGAVGGGMLFDGKCGSVLYAAHILGAATAILVMRCVKCDIEKCSRQNNACIPSFGAALFESVSTSTETVYTISGFVIVSAIVLKFTENTGIIKFISSFGFKEEYVKCLLYGIIEPTNGCIAAAELNMDKIYKCMIISSIIGWSGISVHLQVLGIVKKSGLSVKYYFVGKMVSAIVSPIYTATIFNFYSGNGFMCSARQIVPFAYTAVYFCVFGLMIVIIAYLYKTLKKFKT